MTARPKAPTPRAQPPQLPRLFALHRSTDVNGLSGTGVVAYGVRWPNGQVVTWWKASKVGVSQISVWNSQLDMLRVHGHSGRTTIVWLSADPDDQLLDTVPLRARWSAYQNVCAQRDPARPLARYEAAAALVPELLPLIEAYERLAAASIELRRERGDLHAEVDALRTALDVTADLVGPLEAP